MKTERTDTCLTQSDGQTCILVAVNGVLAAAIALFDPLKPEARGVVAALLQRGIKCHLVTGDNRRTARAIAARLAITSITAECLPAGKAAVVKARTCHAAACVHGSHPRSATMP